MLEVSRLEVTASSKQNYTTVIHSFIFIKLLSSALWRVSMQGGKDIYGAIQ